VHRAYTFKADSVKYDNGWVAFALSQEFCPVSDYSVLFHYWRQCSSCWTT